MILPPLIAPLIPGLLSMLLHAGGASNSFLFVPCTPRPFLLLSYLTTAWKRKTCIVGRSDDPWWAISVSVLANKASFSPGTPEHRYRGNDSAHHALQACRKSSCYYRRSWHAAKKRIKRYNSYRHRCSMCCMYILQLSALIIFYAFAQRQDIFFIN